MRGRVKTRSREQLVPEVRRVSVPARAPCLSPHLSLSLGWKKVQEEKSNYERWKSKRMNAAIFVLAFSFRFNKSHILLVYSPSPLAGSQTPVELFIVWMYRRLNNRQDISTIASAFSLSPSYSCILSPVLLSFSFLAPLPLSISKTFRTCSELSIKPFQQLEWRETEVEWSGLSYFFLLSKSHLWHWDSSVKMWED